MNVYKGLKSIFNSSKSEDFHKSMISDDMIKPDSVIRGNGTGIIFFPDWSFYNPYQKLLYQSLNKLYGTSAYGFHYKYFTIECLEQYAGFCSILHIHWINFFFKPDNENTINDFYSKLLRAKELNYSIIWTVHNFTSHDSNNFEKEVEVCLKLSAMVDHILVHGQFAKDLIIKEYEAESSKIHIIPHGHYATYYKSTISKRKSRKLLKINKQDFVFLFFGNIKAYKGLEDLVEVFIRLNAKYPDTSLLIAGRGLDSEIHEYLQRKTEKYEKIIAHIDFIPDEDVQLFLNASDIMVLPYRNVLTSGAAFLALSFYKPVIAPPIGLLPEVVDEKTGFIFTTQSELEQIMENCLKDANYCIKKKSSFRRKLAKYDWDSLNINPLMKKIFIPGTN